MTGRDLLVNLDSAFLHDERHSTDTPYSARIVLSALTATGKGMDEDVAALLSACACLVVAAPFSIIINFPEFFFLLLHTRSKYKGIS